MRPGNCSTRFCGRARSWGAWLIGAGVLGSVTPTNAALLPQRGLQWLARDVPGVTATADRFTAQQMLAAPESGSLAPLKNTSPYDWFTSSLGMGQRYRIADPWGMPLLYRYVEPHRERVRSERSLFLQTLAPERFSLVPELTWHLEAQSDDDVLHVAPLWGLRPEMLSVTREQRCPRGSERRPIVITGPNHDYERLTLVDCDGAVAPFAIDRVSVLARVQDAPRVDTPLPAEANPSREWPEEWSDGILLLHPRLLWILQNLGEAFPRHRIDIISGYRRDARVNSPHRKGRALDLHVSGVDNATLFAYCRSLKDTGCGYYPNHSFVHLDVRPPGHKDVYWVDASMPGEPSQYVDGWPGVVESGALVGAGGEP